MSYILVSDGMIDWVADKAELFAAMQVLHWTTDGETRWYEPEIKEESETPYSLLCQSVTDRTDEVPDMDRRNELPMMLWREDLKCWVL